MTGNDLPGVWAIEQTLPGSWTYDQLKDELALPHGWHFITRRSAAFAPEDAHLERVARQYLSLQNHDTADQQPVLGYIFGSTILDEAEIRKIAVAKEYRRQGIASALLSAADQLLLTSSVKKCFLELRAANTVALTLYQKNGFQIVGQRKNYYTMPTDDAILVKKDITMLVD